MNLSAKCVFVLLLAFALPPIAQAAVFCVTNPTELQSALTQAAASGGDDEIRIRQGVYTAQQTFTYTASTHGWLYINGGWIQVGENNCAQRGAAASATVLEGAGQRQVMSILYIPMEASSPPRFLVENLSFRSGVGEGFVRGGGLSMVSTASHYVEFWIDNVIIANNSGYFGGGANLSAQNGLFRVANSLFADNSAPTSAYGHLAISVPQSDASRAAIIINSSFVNGTCLGNTGGQRGCGIGVGLGATARVDIINSLFDNNAIADVSSEGAGTVFYNYSRVPLSIGPVIPTVTNALVGDPGFINPAAQDFRLSDSSPFINRGLGTAPLYGFNSFDIAGNLRNRFGAVDAGAYENQTWDFIFSNGFQ